MQVWGNLHEFVVCNLFIHLKSFLYSKSNYIYSGISRLGADLEFRIRGIDQCASLDGI